MHNYIVKVVDQFEQIFSFVPIHQKKCIFHVYVSMYIFLSVLLEYVSSYTNRRIQKYSETKEGQVHHPVFTLNFAS